MTRPNPFKRKLTEADREAIRAQHWDWLRHIAIGAIDGFLVGLAVGLAVIGLDINGIGSMLARSGNQFGYTWLLLVGLGHTFGMVSAGLAIWLRATQEKE